MRRNVLLLVLFALPALADGLDPAKAAAIQRDEQKEMNAVSKKYGNRKPSEMTTDERRAMAEDQASAEQKALSKHGVSAKEWARYEATMSREDRAAMKEAEKALAAQEKAKAEQEKAAAEKKNAEKPADEVQVQKGFSEDKPTVMEEKEGAPPMVEQGLPDDAK